MEERRAIVPVKPVFDATAFTGAYCSRGLASASVEETSRAFAAIGIRRAIVSPLEAVFQDDRAASEARLANETRDLNWMQFKTVNPMQPWWHDELMRARDEWPVAGIRLFGLYHGYDYAATQANAVFKVAAELDLPVQVFCRMQDIRTQRGIMARETDRESIRTVLKQCGDNRVLLSGVSYRNIAAMADDIPPRACFDISRLQGPWKTFEKLIAQVAPDYLVFGSLWPINLPHCPLTQLWFSGLDDATQDAIRYRNLSKFLGSGAESVSG